MTSTRPAAKNSANDASAGNCLITIGICCFNENDWLMDCWRSVLAQTDDRWVAVLVMDGGASERTREIFEEIDHPKLRKYAIPTNAGHGQSRNKAFELTQTPYHFYLDGDDQLMPNSVALVLNAFERHPDAAFVYGNCQCFGSTDDIWTYPTVVTAQDMVEGQPTPGPCAYKVQTWKQLGGLAKELARGNSDYDFHIGAFEAGLHGYHCGQIFYRYRVGHAGKVSQSYGLRYHETHELMVSRHPRFFSERQRRNRFLALGYRRAASANYAAGDPRRAARLAWSACHSGMWQDPQVQVLLLKSWLSPWIYRMLRTAWSFARLGDNLSKRAGQKKNPQCNRKPHDEL
jgi:glycosyltransferase involved in cell wall biosynthesis